MSIDNDSKNNGENTEQSAAVTDVPEDVVKLDNGDLHSHDDGDSALRRMMAGYFMEYASYVIKDRAIPDLRDGFKPVQRRILHSLREIDDGRFHKVANVVGNTMKFHPHGDMSIYNALVHVANKEYFINRQGNFGNIYTGDGASASRYIECRLSPLAREVLFNREITEYEESYDGRNQEPVSLPAKVPVLLMQGSEGIAVGMATKIMPHNFTELLKAQIRILDKRSVVPLYPDFLYGGIMDVSEYNDGNGRIKLQARIEIVSEKTLVIREIPASTTTESLIASIEDAVNKGKLKLVAVEDYTAETVEIEMTLPRGVYADRTLKALYAYTDCEVAISTNLLVIKDDFPVQMTVTEVLKANTEKLVDDLTRELEIELGKLKDQVHNKTLIQIFIENRIYKRIEKCETYETVLSEVRKGLKPHLKLLERDVTDDDIERLLQVPIRRISLFDLNKNKQDLDDILAKIEEVKDNLVHITRTTKKYIRALMKKYGGDFPRHTEIANIEEVNVREIALSNIKVGVDRGSGYIGTAVKSEHHIVCTEYDRIVIIKSDGTYKVTAIPEKLYVGPVAEVAKSDKKKVYSMIYRERKTGLCFAKRFQIDKFILDREYQTVPKGARVVKLFDRCGVVLRCEFFPAPRQKVNEAELNFEDVAVRGVGAKGFRIANKKIQKFLQIKRGTEAGPVPDE